MFGFFRKKKNPPNDATHQVASSISTLLNMQLRLCSSSDKIVDDWAIGYIGGFAGQVSIRKGLKHDERGIGVLLLVFGSIFGEKNRVALSNHYESLIESKNQSALEGDKIGRREAVDLMNGSIMQAMGLCSFCSGSLDQFYESRDPDYKN